MVADSQPNVLAINGNYEKKSYWKIVVKKFVFRKT